MGYLEFIYLFLIVMLFAISIIKKNKRLVIIISLILFLLILSPIIILFAMYSKPHIKVKELGDFRKEIKIKYNYVKQVKDYNYRSMIYKVIIGTTKNLNINEMKELYIDTKEFLLDDSTLHSLKHYCDKYYKKCSSFIEYEIEFDFKSDGNCDFRIEGNLSFVKLSLFNTRRIDL